MDKKIGIAVIGGVVVVGYVAAAWGLGQLAHARFDAIEQELAKQPVPLITVAERQHTPGIFSSTERVTFEFDRALWGAATDRNDDADDIELPEGMSEEEEAEMREQLEALRDLRDMEDEPSEPVRFTLLNRIQHGPLPGFTSFGLARIETTLELSEETRAELAKVLGDREPIVMDTLIGYTGGGRTHLTSPPFEVSEGDANISWQGIDGTFGYSRNADSLTCDVTALGLDGALPNGIDFHMGKLGLNCDLERVFGDLYSGSTSMTLAGMRGSFGPTMPSMVFENLGYKADILVDGDYLDMIMEFGIGSLEASDFTMTDLRYDVGIEHLHGPTYAKLVAEFQGLNAQVATAGIDPNAMMNSMLDYAYDLLEHSPELVIKKVGFSMPEGDAAVSGAVKLNDFSKAELQAAGHPLAILGKIDASIDVSFSDGLLERDWSSGESADGEPKLSPAERVAAVRNQISQLEQAGILLRKGDQLVTRLEFKNGALTANGKPFGPLGQ